MGSVIIVPVDSEVRYLHTWNDPYVTFQTSEGLGQSLPEDLPGIISLTKAEGIFSKSFSVGPYTAGTEIRVYVEGDPSKNNTYSGAVVSPVANGFSIQWTDNKPNDTTTLVQFVLPGNAVPPLRQRQRLTSTPRMRQQVR